MKKLQNIDIKIILVLLVILLIYSITLLVTILQSTSKEEKPTTSEVTYSEVVVSALNNGYDSLLEDKSDHIKEEINSIPLYKCKDYDDNYYQLSNELQIYTYEICQEYGISEYYEVILAQMMTESRYIEGLISSSNDYGLMQINKCNHEWLSEKLGISDFSDSKSSIKSGVYIMSLFFKEGYSVPQALSKYNTGTAYNSTSYSSKVLGYLDRLELIE